MLKKLLPLTRNFYFITTFVFVLWMIFFDANDTFTQVKNTYQLRQLKTDTAFYNQKIKQVKKDKKELTGNDELLEKYAREKYLMKKKEEDIFVIVEEKKQ